jgi:hypothetical protein
MSSPLPGGAHNMGSGSFDGASMPKASNAPEASRGDAAQYCKNRRRLVARTVGDVIGKSSLPLFFFCRQDDSSRNRGSEGSDNAGQPWHAPAISSPSRNRPDVTKRQASQWDRYRRGGVIGAGIPIIRSLEQPKDC